MSDVFERYAPGWADDAVEMMASRTAEQRASFFLRLLTPGMRVLDVGCGPGSITCGLARTVAPNGGVVGVDVEPSQVQSAQLEAKRQRLTNVHFQVGSIYALPFEDGTFDAVFAHAVLEHLAHPDAALSELRRLLCRGGVIGVADSDWSGAVVEPRSADVDLALRCHFRLRQDAGGDPFAGARLPALIENAGFQKMTESIRDETDMSYGDLARYVGARIETAMLAADASAQDELERCAAAARRWARHDRGRFTQRWVLLTARRY
jgi:ubiquinone/menaquinone biosynthesis C-methylase UbiE